ncbi:unnamed protein product [Closterium sp. Naga37s-1]|nr:unnamed protein product [Closterium sp. Naga37s-1]
MDGQIVASCFGNTNGSTAAGSPVAADSTAADSVAAGWNDDAGGFTVVDFPWNCGVLPQTAAASSAASLSDADVLLPVEAVDIAPSLHSAGDIYESLPYPIRIPQYPSTSLSSLPTCCLTPLHCLASAFCPTWFSPLIPTRPPSHPPSYQVRAHAVVAIPNPLTLSVAYRLVVSDVSAESAPSELDGSALMSVLQRICAWLETADTWLLSGHPDVAMQATVDPDEVAKVLDETHVAWAELYVLSQPFSPSELPLSSIPEYAAHTEPSAAAEAPTITPTLTPTLKPTSTPTLNPTPTLTPNPTLTPTPTLAPNPMLSPAPSSSPPDTSARPYTLPLTDTAPVPRPGSAPSCTRAAADSPVATHAAAAGAGAEAGAVGAAADRPGDEAASLGNPPALTRRSSTGRRSAHRVAPSASPHPSAPLPSASSSSTRSHISAAHSGGTLTGGAHSGGTLTGGGQVGAHSNGACNSGAQAGERWRMAAAGARSMAVGGGRRGGGRGGTGSGMAAGKGGGRRVGTSVEAGAGGWVEGSGGCAGGVNGGSGGRGGRGARGGRGEGAFVLKGNILPQHAVNGPSAAHAVGAGAASGVGAGAVGHTIGEQNLMVPYRYRATTGYQ